MTVIENHRQTRLFNLISAICFLLAGIFMLGWQALPIPVYMVRSIALAIVALLIGILYISKPMYLNISITNSKITIKYYSLFPLWPSLFKKRLIEITKSDFKGYDIEEYNYGLTRELHLKTRLQQGMLTSFPPVSILLLSRTQEKELLAALETFAR